MFTPEQQNEIIQKRHEIVINYCKEKGWNPETITAEQIMEIRKLPAWMKVPFNVARIDFSEFEGTYNLDEAKYIALKMNEKTKGATLEAAKFDVPKPTTITPMYAPPSIQPLPMKSGKQLRRERREEERKNNKSKK